MEDSMNTQASPRSWSYEVVEVVSPSTAGRDRGMKWDRNAAFGVSQYWVADADRKHVDMHRTSGGSHEPERVTDVLHWQPAAGGPVLDISILDLLGNLPL